MPISLFFEFLLLPQATKLKAAPETSANAPKYRFALLIQKAPPNKLKIFEFYSMILK